MERLIKPQPRHKPAREIFRYLVEKAARAFMGEPFVLIPRHRVERLRQLERREELQLAERRGDHEFLDRELAKVQVTSEKEFRSPVTPISEWPDEDFSDSITDASEQQKNTTKS